MVVREIRLLLSPTHLDLLRKVQHELFELFGALHCGEGDGHFWDGAMSGNGGDTTGELRLGSVNYLYRPSRR